MSQTDRRTDDLLWHNHALYDKTYLIIIIIIIIIFCYYFHNLFSLGTVAAHRLPNAVKLLSCKCCKRWRGFFSFKRRAAPQKWVLQCGASAALIMATGRLISFSSVVAYFRQAELHRIIPTTDSDVCLSVSISFRPDDVTPVKFEQYYCSSTPRLPSPGRNILVLYAEADLGGGQDRAKQRWQ